jgi:hypothetical protein
VVTCPPVGMTLCWEWSRDFLAFESSSGTRFIAAWSPSLTLRFPVVAAVSVEVGVSVAP